MAKNLKKVTTVEQQICKLKQRGVAISDYDKAKEYLLDIGYYRLGFYMFPFELTYPKLGRNRKHLVKVGTRIEDAVALYYFDFDLRNILNRFLSRIEVAIRTTMIYELSNKYANNPLWFVDKTVVEDEFVKGFDSKVYDTIRKKDVIKRHHSNYRNDNYAPAWKTMEFMVFGNLTMLYNKLLLEEDKKLVSRHFGVKNTTVFFYYIEVVRQIRNACAHGSVLYDLNLYTPVKNGPAGYFTGKDRHSFAVALHVVRFFLSKISCNRLNDFEYELVKAAEILLRKCPSLKSLIKNKTGISVE